MSRVVCECGREVARSYLSKHKRTKIHKHLMSSKKSKYKSREERIKKSREEREAVTGKRFITRKGRFKISDNINKKYIDRILDFYDKNHPRRHIKLRNIEAFLRRRHYKGKYGRDNLRTMLTKAIEALIAGIKVLPYLRKRLVLDDIYDHDYFDMIKKNLTRTKKKYKKFLKGDWYNKTVRQMETSKGKNLDNVDAYNFIRDVSRGLRFVHSWVRIIEAGRGSYKKHLKSLSDYKKEEMKEQKKRDKFMAEWRADIKRVEDKIKGRKKKHEQWLKKYGNDPKYIVVGDTAYLREHYNSFADDDSEDD